MVTNDRSLNGPSTYAPACVSVFAVERLAVNRLRTVVPLIDRFCHLATVKGFPAIVPFNYKLNYLSRSPVFLCSPRFGGRARAGEGQRGETIGFDFKTVFPADRGSLRHHEARNTRR